jgi:serine/threonine protein kinase
MEWIRGVSLDRLLQISLSQSLRKTIATKLIEAVGLLHTQQIVHKDLKPQNIIITPDNRLYLIDFGFAAENKRVLSNNNSIQGTPRFIAPEYWAYDKPIDYIKSDIYALGIVLNDLLGSDLPEYLNRCSSQDPGMRPETIEDFFSSWKNSTCFSNSSPEWYSVISRATHEHLATRFYSAALDLKRRGQIRNVYQVIAELIDEMPDHPQAIALLQSLSIKKSKKNQVFALLSAVFILILGTTAFFTGKFFAETELPYKLKSSKSYTTDSLINANSPVEKKQHLRSLLLKNYDGISLIKAELFCLLPDTMGLLYVDGKQIDTLSVTIFPEIRLFLDQGFHSIKWTSKVTSATTIESVTLLPFERKRIKLTFTKE